MYVYNDVNNFFFDTSLLMRYKYVFNGVNGRVSLSASSDKKWNLLESEEAGLALVRSIEKTAVCDLSASRRWDGVTLLHLAAARGYSEMLVELLKLQVKLEGSFIILSPAVGEAHTSWYNEGHLRAP